MSIRIRVVDGVTVAICAARSVEKPGDIYLDDAAHHALASKFTEDFTSEGGLISVDARESDLRLREESNNPNRDWWGVCVREGTLMLQFFVHGDPLSQGSMRPVPRGRKKSFATASRHSFSFKDAVGAVRFTSENPKLKNWRSMVAGEAWVARGAGHAPWTSHVVMVCRFRISRDRDIDKLARAVLDSLTGVVYVDDKQVRELHIFRRETGPLGVLVTMWELLV